MGKKSEIDLAARLEQEYKKWEYCKENGASDPFGEDGYSMHLIRNHIISYKRQIEEKYHNDISQYPEIYFRELPPEVNHIYMANAGAIRDISRETLEICLADASFQYLLINHEKLTKKEAEKISVHNVLGYVSGLAHALKQDNLVTMRRHVSGLMRHQESFASCAEKMKKILSDTERKPMEQQLTLFQFGLEAGQCR